MKLYHYVSSAKYLEMVRQKCLIPTAPFNSRIKAEDWTEYAKGFPFKVFPHYTCCFLEREPAVWKEWGLFDLLMEEFSAGDLLLSLDVEDGDMPILVRNHVHHSPKMYGVAPDIWRRREVRDSRPDLREAWYQSTTLLKDYDGSFVCPEVLIPFNIPLNLIQVTGEEDG